MDYDVYYNQKKRFDIISIKNKKGFDIMTNKELFKLWEKFRAKQYHCFPDKNGNYPCDNGKPCDKCCTNEAICWFASWKRQKENRPANYRIYVTDDATYEFGADYTREEAIEQAIEWFSERKPRVHVEEF